MKAQEHVPKQPCKGSKPIAQGIALGGPCDMRHALKGQKTFLYYSSAPSERRMIYAIPQGGALGYGPTALAGRWWYPPG